MPHMREYIHGAIAAHRATPADTDAEPVYLVWSNRYRGWWGDGGHGYDIDVWQAGRFTEAQALDMCGRRTWEKGAVPPEVMVLAPEHGQEMFSVGALRSMPETMRERVEEATKAAVARRLADQSGEAS